MHRGAWFNSISHLIGSAAALAGTACLIVIYLLMGWLVVGALKPLMARLPLRGELWLLAGGLYYTAGIVFYVLDKRVRHFHGIWHPFVLAGSLCHYITILNYVAWTGK